MRYVVDRPSSVMRSSWVFFVPVFPTTVRQTFVEKVWMVRQTLVRQTFFVEKVSTVRQTFVEKVSISLFVSFFVSLFLCHDIPGLAIVGTFSVPTMFFCLNSFVNYFRYHLMTPKSNLCSPFFHLGIGKVIKNILIFIFLVQQIFPQMVNFFVPCDGKCPYKIRRKHVIFELNFNNTFISICQ